MKESARAGRDVTLRRPATATVDGRNRLRNMSRGRDNHEGMYTEKWFERKDRGFGSDMKAHFKVSLGLCVCMHACMCLCMYVYTEKWFDRRDRGFGSGMKAHFKVKNTCIHTYIMHTHIHNKAHFKVSLGLRVYARVCVCACTCTLRKGLRGGIEDLGVT